MAHPIIDMFEEQAALLNIRQSGEGLDEAIAKLASWMECADLEMDDWTALAEIGGVLYREGLRRRQK